MSQPPPQFSSRRQMREAERAAAFSLPTDAPLAPAPAVTPAPPVAPAPVAPIAPLTRREIRERERAAGGFTGLDAQVAPPPAASPPAPAPATRTPPPAQQASPPAYSSVPPVPPARETWAPEPTDSEPFFGLYPAYSGAPVAHHMVMNEPPVTTGSIPIALPDGTLLHTGSIEIPVGVQPQHQAVVANARQVDSALIAQAHRQPVSIITPTSTTGLVNNGAAVNVIPGNVKKGRASVYLILTAVVVMVGVGGLLIGAYLLGILK